VKRQAAAGAAVGASVPGKEDDAGELMAKQLEAAELALDKGCTATLFESVLKAVNDNGTVAAPLGIHLDNLKAITTDDNTRAILVSTKPYCVQ